MEYLDLGIILVYLIFLLAAGVFFARRASSSPDSYFLGQNRLPWWALGASGMSSNLDVAGTMTLVTLFYVIGVQAFFVEMRGGVVLPIAVFLAFIGKWHRRSEVMTTAEWMHLRFGSGWQGNAARIMAAFTYLIITVGMVVFFLAASGRFLAPFIPLTEEQCTWLVLAVAVVYTMLSGLHGVVWTDVLQSGLLIGAALYVAVTAFFLYTPELAAQWEGAEWNQLYPPMTAEGLGSSLGVDYSVFGFFLLAWIAKGLVEGLGGSGGSAYMAQRYYAARNERDCMRIGMVWTLCFAIRWPMVLGFAILGVALGLQDQNPEGVLPAVLSSEYFPPGIRGLVLAAMLAAAMSTFDSTLNAGASYVVQDIYKPLRKHASNRELVWVGYASLLGIVGIGLILNAQVESILDVWVTIVIQLFPAFLVPFALRWFWGRLNGAGFSLGILAGFAAAFGLGALELGWNDVQMLGTIGAASLLGVLIGTYNFSPTTKSVSQTFYDRVRPFGWWPKAWTRPHRREHRADGLRLFIALIWQICTFLLPMGIMLRLWDQTAIAAALWIVATIYLAREAFGKTPSEDPQETIGTNSK
ncbi:MAG: hypothetical protein ACFCU3_05425 [Verrucomicrobiales bacterium]